MRGLIGEGIARYGAAVTVEHEGEAAQGLAFVQPLRKETRKEPFSVGPLGAVEERCWRYLGQAELPLQGGDRVIFEGKSYEVRRAEAVYIGAAVSHYWAILDREEKA